MKRLRAIINVSDSLKGVLTPFHAQVEVLNSSSWVDQVQNFRQEIRQSDYRNDDLKYDLNCEKLYDYIDFK